MKKTIKNILRGIIIITILTSIIILAKFAWARYISKIEGNASADIAHFSFTVSEQSSDSLTIDLAGTRIKNDTASVDSSTVAPGTKGALAFNINANVSDVSLAYNIDIDISNIPKNLIFYYDEEMTRAIYHSSNSININGFFYQNIANKSIIQYIYWNWPLETGQTQDEIDENDLTDSMSMGTAITANIHVTGEQIKEVPTISHLTYHANGGAMDDYGNSEKLTKIIINNNIDEISPTASRPGYQFSGWSENLLEGVTFTEQYITPDNHIASADYNNLLSDYISVEQGAIYEFSLSHNETTVVDWYGYAWYSDTDANSIIETRHAGYFPNNFEGFTLNIVPPEGAKYLRIGARHMNIGSSQGGVVITSANYYLTSYDRKLSLDLLDGMDMTATYIAADNQIVSADCNNLLSDYIQVEEGGTYEFYLSHNKTTTRDWYGYAWYTDTEVNSVIGSRYVGSFGADCNEGFSINITAPKGAKYLRIGARHMNIGSSQGGDEITSAVYSLKKLTIENRILFAIWRSTEV